MLATPFQAVTGKRRLLLVGDSIAPNDKYPEVAGAKAQMTSVASHFKDANRQIISGQAATPAAYLDSHPAQFTDLHFVAHGIASRLSPLDSAIVLSRPTADSDAFKLYARDIKTHSLQADQPSRPATEPGGGLRRRSGWSGCHGPSHGGARQTWSPALWDASPTEKLMARFYDELERGKNPKLRFLNPPNFLYHCRIE